jgi:hypothetical protein
MQTDARCKRRAVRDDGLFQQAGYALRNYCNWAGWQYWLDPLVPGLPILGPLCRDDVDRAISQMTAPATTWPST